MSKFKTSQENSTQKSEQSLSFADSLKNQTKSVEQMQIDNGLKMDIHPYTGDIKLYNFEKPLSFTRSNKDYYEISFKELYEFEGELLQQVSVYKKDVNKGFSTSTFLLDPKLGVNSQGEQVCITDDYYRGLLRTPSQKGDLKGFFDLDSLGKLPSDYIGNLKTGKNGKPTRGYNPEIYTKYLEQFKEVEKNLTKKQESIDKENLKGILNRAKENRDWQKENYDPNNECRQLNDTDDLR